MEKLTTKTFKMTISKNDSDFKYIGDKPCIIDWYTDWCTPCKQIAPILEELKLEYDGKIDFYKIDSENEYELSSKFNIRSVPTLMFITNDGEIKQQSGFLPKNKIKEIITNSFQI